MSPDKQRIAIAEVCGYTNIRESKPWEAWDDRPEIRLVGDIEKGGIEVPDYLNDLNAMHEAEKVLTKEQYEAWAGHMANICTRPTYAEALFVSYWSRGFKIMSSTASQRAEAFLRTLGKWED